MPKILWYEKYDIGTIFCCDIDRFVLSRDSFQCWIRKKNRLSMDGDMDVRRFYFKTRFGMEWEVFVSKESECGNLLISFSTDANYIASIISSPGFKFSHF